MSRNLDTTRCVLCKSEVELRAPLYQIGPGVRYCSGMWVQDAVCIVCGAKYTAWVTPIPKEGYDLARRTSEIHRINELGFYDLSWRSTFNDEPGKEDLPSIMPQVWRVVVVYAGPDKVIHHYLPLE